MVIMLFVPGQLQAADAEYVHGQHSCHRYRFGSAFYGNHAHCQPNALVELAGEALCRNILVPEGDRASCSMVRTYLAMLVSFSVLTANERTICIQHCRTRLR